MPINGHTLDLTEAIYEQTRLLEQVKIQLERMPDNLHLVSTRIEGVVKEMHVLNASVSKMTDPQNGYVALIAGKKQVPLITHTVVTVALAACLVAAILALTNSNIYYGDFYIGKKNNAAETNPSR
jgi:hypothetical protein